MHSFCGQLSTLLVVEHFGASASGPHSGGHMLVVAASFRGVDEVVSLLSQPRNRPNATTSPPLIASEKQKPERWQRPGLDALRK